MNDSLSSPALHRLQKARTKKFQRGELLSWTSITHRKTIGLVLLEDGSRLIAPLLIDQPSIGMKLLPRMRLVSVSSDGLRAYDVAFEEVVSKSSEIKCVDTEVFPRYILALTGPSGVGKSTISRLLTNVLTGSVEHVPILTTRVPKSGDDGEYLHVTQEEFVSMEKRGEIIAAVRIPSAASEMRCYGYAARDIESIWKSGKLPVVITEMHLLQGLASHYGRRSVLSFGLLPPGRSRRAMLSSLLFRLRGRGRDTEEEINERLKIAEADLAFFENESSLFDDLIVNDNLDAVLDLLTGHMRGFGVIPVNNGSEA